ncbi:lateral flagellar M-ring protein FliFL [Aeromonas enteropelogenes]|uniref:Flagellar M-ring protein n=1 Tax=Aeromonas enteropelogenes TaxID=29489 RepID=A0ABU9JBN3_AEREN|nr:MULTISPECIES: lateral flagellar M-ring protein FliFL [Aeromonas]MBL0458097.1 lateral flagellar M-ring protein FliFL [Aeromonas enteropelogenes]MBL0521826.1 lateral flagellar M-ring protein FliFL [Aeromonas enteropelogenes]MCZ0752097.1 lateral flagellar M-ring protein FliFL [Aeromonas enteropelogenes]QXC35271.1 lateral flagellar M-ring protein FliFL [Aeromonas sp. FDAARGOS 1407]RQM62163.1 flagellar M-ring protein FliF [Aeromonas enteropelogenes]
MTELVTSRPGEQDGSLKDRLQEGLRHWRNLSRDNKSILTIALLAAIVAGTIVVILWTSSKNYVPLYGKQELYDTANIMEMLEKEQIPFRLEKSSGQILVPEHQLAPVRMALAARGVRAAMPAGLEGLNAVTGLGTSEFMEGARYRHALEGELARTIISLDAIRSARVHLAIPKRTLFVGRDEEKPSASVMLDLQPGQSLEPGQVEAIANLVAGSISGMKPGAVTVVDQAGQLLSAEVGDKATFGKQSVQQMEYTRKLEQYIRQRANDMLIPMLGNGNFRVQIAADVNFNAVEETQQQLDPSGVLTRESSKSDKTIDSLALGIPGALSNRPPETTANAAEDGKEKEAPSKGDARTERQEVTKQYENSRTIVHTRYQQGRLEKINVSVLLNQQIAPKEGWNADQLEQIRQMVERAVGFDQTRGDQISLQVFSFTGAPAVTIPESSWWETPYWQDSLRYLVGGLLGLTLVFFGIRPLVKHLVRTQQPVDETVEQEEEQEPTVGLAMRRSGDEEDEAATAMSNSLIRSEGAGQPHFAAVDMDSLPEPGSELEVQLKHLQLLVEKDTARVAEVIRTWVSGNEQR